MDIPLFSHKKQSNTYLGLFLKEQEGIGIVMVLQNGKITVIHQEKFTYTNGWDTIVEDIDELLLKLEKSTHAELRETIFFVYSHFIDPHTQNIKKQYLQKIKDIVKNLELEALGYIECYEAVVRFLEVREEMPLTAILIEIDKTKLTMMVYKGGKQSFLKVIAHTGNLIEDLLEGFNEMKGMFLLPARMILYNSTDLDDASTKIISYRWSEKLFAQIPRVEIVKNSDIITGLARIFEQQVAQKQTSIQSSDQGKKEIMGFVVGGDPGQKPVQQDVPSTSKSKSSFPFFSVFSGFAKIKPSVNFKEIPSFFARFKVSRSIGVLFGIVIILLGLFLNEYFLHKAKLTVFVSSQSVSSDVPVTGSYSGSDPSALLIQVATASADYSASQPATGTHQVGKKATGTVTIYNFDNVQKTFNQGTDLTVDNLSFTLDNDVKVASASISSSNETVPGQEQGSVTAGDIGPSYNIDKGKRFKIDELAETIYYAINDSSFTGGSAKQVTTVSKNDLNNLDKTILSQAKTKMRNTVNVSAQEKIIDSLSSTSINRITYSKEVGEEAQSVNGQAKVDYSYQYYDDNAMRDRLISALQKEVRSGLSLTKDSIYYSIKSVRVNGNTVSLDVSANAKAVQSVDKNKLQVMLTIKTSAQVKDILRNSYHVTSYQLSNQDPIPLLGLFMPVFRNNIQIVSSSE